MMTPLHLAASVASISRPKRDAVIDAAQAALSDVILPALAVREIQTSLQVFQRDSTLYAPSGWAPGSVDWSEARSAADLAGFAISVTVPTAPRNNVGLAMIFGSLSGPRRNIDGSLGISETTVSWSLRRDAVRNGFIDDDLQDRAVAWTTETFARLDGSAGYLTLDHVTSSPDGFSPYEQATHRTAAQRDFDAHVWTSGWGMPLTDRHVAALGGPAALPDHDELARRLPAGGWWLQASRRIEELTDLQVDSIRSLLTPLLPPGAQALTDYDEDPPLRV